VEKGGCRDVQIRIKTMEMDMDFEAKPTKILVSSMRLYGQLVFTIVQTNVSFTVDIPSTQSHIRCYTRIYVFSN